MQKWQIVFWISTANSDGEADGEFREYETTTYFAKKALLVIPANGFNPPATGYPW